MHDSKRQCFLAALKVFDLWVAVSAFTLATLPMFEHWSISFREFLSLRIRLSNLVIFAAMLLAWHLVFSLCGLYASHRLSTWQSELATLFKATSSATLLVTIAALTFQIRMVTPLSIARFWIFSWLMFVFGRMALRATLRNLRRHGRNLRYMLILGTNPRATYFARRLEEKPELGYRVLGFVDEQWHGLREFRESGNQLCCTLEDLAEFLRHNVVDEVAIYLPLRSFYVYACEVAELCEQHGIIMRFDPDIFNLKTARSRADVFDGNAVVTAYTGRLDGWPSLIKRTLDLVGSAVLIALLSPLLLAAAALIKATSKGPVFFLQQRVGLNKRKFWIYKFRTMIPDAEKLLAGLATLNEATGPVFKIKKDPRITAVGRFLRRTSIDELPQLFNVFKGDMSLVGPRPLPVRDYEGFNEDWQRRRFSVRPGITCLWQVNGRSSIAFDRWMQLDLQYLDEWSLWLDLKILAQTIPAVLKGSGAA